MRKCVIFDFDGVIINSRDLQKKALKKAYQDIIGIGEPPYEEFFLLSGDSLSNIFNHLNLPLSMIPIYTTVSRENIFMIKVNQGMYEVLNILNQLGVYCALCTGKSRERTLEILKYLDIDFFFSQIVCSDDVKQPKPNKESVIKIMNQLNLNPENTIFVGDGINDILCAHNAGIASIAVSWGDIKGDILERYEPDKIANTPEQLAGYLKEWINNKLICEKYKLYSNK